MCCSSGRGYGIAIGFAIHDISFFERVIAQIEEASGTVLGAHIQPVVSAYAAFRYREPFRSLCFLENFVVDRLPRRVAFFALKEGSKGRALNAVRKWNPAQIQKGGHGVNGGIDQFGTDLSVGELPGPADDEGHAHRGLVVHLLAHAAVFAGHLPVVAGEIDDGVVGQALLVQMVQDTSHVVVDGRGE